MNSYPEYNNVQKCLNVIESILNWGDSNNWHNDVFIELSDKIQGKTGVLLSPTTLKRVWGKVNYKSAPSISTLNTLAQFAGYENWRAFKQEEHQKQNSWFQEKISPNIGIIMGAAAIMTLIFISFYSLTGTNQKLDDINLDDIKFKSTSISEGLPNTVVFDFDISPIESDSILIQQFWDPTKTIKINKTQKQATGQYYYPGYFRAKIVVEGVILKEHDLFIESNGWLGTINYEPIPKYIKEQNILNDKLSFGKSIIDEVKESKEPLVTAFQRVEEFDSISGDNFELRTSLKNVYNDKWAVCETTRIVILGTKSAMIIPFSIPGCASELSVMLSEKFISGKENDLSSFGLDLSVYNDIEIVIKDYKVTVTANEMDLFENSYTESIGEIVGVRYQFLGAGEVKSSVLTFNNKEYNLLNKN